VQWRRSIVDNVGRRDGCHLGGACMDTGVHGCPRNVFEFMSKMACLVHFYAQVF